MKALFLVVLLAPLSASAITVSDPQLVRLADGHAVNCKEVFEGGKTAFVPELQSAAGDDKTVSLMVSMKFELCVRNGDELHFADRKPLDPVFTHDGDGNEVRTEYRNPQLLIGSDETSSFTEVPLTDESSQSAGFQFLPEQMLDKQDLALFQAGKPVKLRMTMLYRSVGTSYNLRGDATPLGFVFGGSYTLFLTLTQ